MALAGYEAHLATKNFDDTQIQGMLQQSVGSVGGSAYCAPSRGDAKTSQQDVVDQLFTYHTPSTQQVEAMKDIRETAKHLAQLILRKVPAGADRTSAIRKVREAVMTANAAIVLDGLNL